MEVPPGRSPIISIGKRCMLDGYEFHWPRGQTPYLLDPSGSRIKLVVYNFVPSISSGGESSTFNGKAHPSESTMGVTQELATTNELLETDEVDPDARSSGLHPSPSEPPDLPRGGQESDEDDDAAGHKWCAMSPEREQELRAICGQLVQVKNLINPKLVWRTIVLGYLQDAPTYEIRRRC